jgi:hypothetical protein
MIILMKCLFLNWASFVIFYRAERFRVIIGSGGLFASLILVHIGMGLFGKVGRQEGWSSSYQKVDA